jgi:hypothetical protein
MADNDQPPFQFPPPVVPQPGFFNFPVAPPGHFIVGLPANANQVAGAAAAPPPPPQAGFQFNWNGPPIGANDWMGALFAANDAGPVFDAVAPWERRAPPPEKRAGG